MACHSLLVILVSVSAERILDLMSLFLRWSSYMSCYGNPHPATGDWVVFVDRYSQILLISTHWFLKISDL